MRKVLVLAFAISILAAAPTAFATSFGFSDIPDTDIPAINIAGNFLGDISGSGSQVLFKIANIGPVTSFIRQIYWEYNGSLLSGGSFSSANSTGIVALGGVNFVWDSPVNNPPQGNAISFTADLETIADKPGSGKQGVDVGETAAFLFNGTFSTVLAALNDGSLRIALHAQGIAPTGGSDSYVNTPPTPPTSVPEPAIILLLGTGLISLAGFGIRRSKKI